MNPVRLLSSLVVVVACAAFVEADDKPAKKTQREALKDFNLLVGGWKGTGEPEGTRTEKQQGFWIEKIRWEWQFKGEDAWIKIDILEGKYFTEAELRYFPDKDLYRLILKAATKDKEALTFDGTYENKRLTVERIDPATKDTQRLVFSLLHDKRYLYRYEVRKADKTSFTKLYQVGATREGVAFASPSDSDPVCIVSEGKGTIAVSHKGKTYYVCCSGCRDEFRANPEKYIKEFEDKQKQKKDK